MQTTPSSWCYRYSACQHGRQNDGRASSNEATRRSRRQLIKYTAAAERARRGDCVRPSTGWTDAATAADIWSLCVRRAPARTAASDVTNDRALNKTGGRPGVIVHGRMDGTAACTAGQRSAWSTDGGLERDRERERRRYVSRTCADWCRRLPIVMLYSPSCELVAC